ncbi:MAG: hypothetical protein P3B76_07555 [Gemmatimonadota bacterium]|nr:hypothetical protein [Gemmatimonadota bacterium]
MSRTVWSRWTILLLALLASVASPTLAVAHGMAHAHAAEGHHGEDHSNRDGDGDGDGTALTEQDHGHRHAHARVEPAATGRQDVRHGLEAPVISAPAALVPPLLSHARPPRSRWDAVALARPAPDTGPPPALRAPPTC